MHLLTDILTAGLTARRSADHLAFVRLALGPGVTRTPPAGTLHAFRAALGRAWRVPCSNHLKEPLWRLAAGAILGSRVRPWTCPCASDLPQPVCGRRHAFWDCPVAVAVRSQLAGLGPVPPPCSSVWLLRPPASDVCASAWALICMVAIYAMERGRRGLWAAQTVAGTSRLSPSAIAAIANASVADFWWALTDFAESHPDPPSTWSLRADHPFLCLRSGRLTVRGPVR